MRNFLVALLFLLSAKVSAESLYYIGVVSDQQRASVLQQWLPTAGWLSQKLGHRFAVRVIRPEQLPDMLDKYPVDFLVGSTGDYVRFAQDYELQPLLNLNVNVNNQPLSSMGAVFVARRDRADITALSDIKGKRLMALSDASFGSFYMGWGELNALGINPFDDTKLQFARTQPQQVVFAVRDGLADMGVVATGVLETMQQQGQINLSHFRVLNTHVASGFPFKLSSQLYPRDNLSVFPHVPQGVSTAVKQALLLLQPQHAVSVAGQYHSWRLPIDDTLIHTLYRDISFGPYDYIDIPPVLLFILVPLTALFSFQCFFGLRIFSVEKCRGVGQGGLFLTMIGLTGWLLWQAQSQLHAEREEHIVQARESVLNSLTQLSSEVAGQQKALKSLAKRASPLIVALRNDAENTAYFSQLRKVVAETFDGYEAFNITDELGLPVLNYVGTHLGPRSSSNLQRLAQTRQAYNGMRMDNTRVNGVDHYHYDIVATWQHEDQRGFLVVSLKATSLVRFLSNVPLGHHLLLVLQGRQDHVELSKWGPKLSHTRNDRLLSTEMEYVLYSAYIPGTDWRLLAVYDDKLSAAGHSRIKWTTGVLIVLLWVFFGSVSLFVRRRNISNNKGVSSPVG